jgi:hypothetical protein
MKVARRLPPFLAISAFMAAANFVNAEEPRQEDDAKFIIAKSLKAGGSVEKISKFSALSVNGTCMIHGDKELPFAASFEGPNRFRVEIQDSA